MMRNGLNLMVYMLWLVETIFVATSYTILVPTEESLNRIPWLKEVQRAIVSFNLLEENENITQLEDGKTYDIILNSTNGMSQQIPTFTVHVDTLSEEYQIFGQDSIQLKNKLST